MKRYDFAVFRDDRYVANALLTAAQAKRMEADGYRCIRVRDTVGEGLPSFRVRSYVKRERRNSRRWDR